MMPRMRTLSLTVAALAFGCPTTKAVVTKDILIGAAVPITGSNADSYWITAMELAVNEMNQALAASKNSKNVRFKLLYQDNENNTALAQTIAQNFAAQGAKFLYGDSSPINAALNYLNYDPNTPMNVPVICSPCTNVNFHASLATVTNKVSATYINTGAFVASVPQLFAAVADANQWLWRTTGVNAGAPGPANTSPIYGMYQLLLSQGPHQNGDVDGNGTIKVVAYTDNLKGGGGSTSPCSQYTTFTAQVQPQYVSEIRCEVIDGPDISQSASSINYTQQAAYTFDNANETSTPTIPAGNETSGNGTLGMVPIPSLSTAGVTQTMIDTQTQIQAFYGGSASFDAKGDVISPLAADGPPDIIDVSVIPAFDGPFFQAIAAGGYQTAFPKVAYFAGQSFIREAVLLTLGAQINGVIGNDNLRVAQNASGTHFEQAFEANSGAQPAAYTSNVYDAFVLGMLATLKAGLSLSDPTTVTPSAVRTALGEVNVPGALLIATGPAAFEQAINAIAAGTDINYDGASGPVDFDALGNVMSNLEIYGVENQRWVSKVVYDCLSDPNCTPENQNCACTAVPQ